MIYRIDKVNWPEEWPEKPEVGVEVKNDHEKLWLTYHVKGEQVRAITTEDQGPVWEDSCVEFFCQVPGDKHYFNFEANCIGAMVASRRLGRNEDVVPFSSEEMQTIKRKCSFPREVIEERDGLWSWEVELEIPLKLIFRDLKPVFPQRLKVNFYKCADKTKKPHFLSWQPIELPKPNFHCPEYFKEITLE
ncbi:MAG: hypothetical protein J5612_00480 [Paludibacteraceae bacterium]|nr:hypothetical protein [Paludibacteraceae bacterium]